jgi:hypothetical protein
MLVDVRNIKREQDVLHRFDVDSYRQCADFAKCSARLSIEVGIDL